jgi:hypothetical protein
VDYYASWGGRGEAGAPQLRTISGVGTVDEIRQHVFEILAGN